MEKKEIDEKEFIALRNPEIDLEERRKAKEEFNELIKKSVIMSNEDANRLHPEENPTELIKELKIMYERIIESLKLYLDLKEEYYPIIACWIIGTYIHEQMLTYPYLYFNATKESGKSRSVRLITYLSKDGEMVNSLTEAVLFRTKGTIGIDEFEKASRKGSETLIELLNSAYKRGTKVKRMKKARTPTGEEQVIETFEVFRPIIMANIWGIDNVLEDRAFTIMLEKTTSDIIPNLLEIWEFDTGINEIKSFLTQKCSLCNVVSLQNVYKDWNNYLIDSYKNNTNYITTGTNNYIKLHLFKKIKETGIKGRMLELSFPIIIIADMISEEIVDSVIFSLKNISIERNQEAYLENKDILLVDMISQEVENEYFISVRSVVEKFKQFSQNNEEWINERWIGRALKRLGLAKEKKRTERGIEVKLDYQKAKEKMRMFK